MANHMISLITSSTTDPRVISSEGENKNRIVLTTNNISHLFDNFDTIVNKIN